MLESAWIAVFVVFIISIIFPELPEKWRVFYSTKWQFSWKRNNDKIRI